MPTPYESMMNVQQSGIEQPSMFGSLIGKKPVNWKIDREGGLALENGTYLSPEYFNGDNTFNGKSIFSAGDYLAAGGGQSGASPSIYSMFTKPDGSMDWSGAGAIASGVGSIFNAYNQGQYQDKMANLYKQQYDMQKAQQERANQRQDLAQANYNKAMGV